MTSLDPSPLAVHRVTFRPYRISGASALDLRAAIALLGPRHHGAAFGGLTSWTVRWAFTTVMRDGRAAAGDVSVVLEAEVRLPEWQAPRSASAATRAAFRAYVLALAEHEAGHLAVARAA